MISLADAIINNQDEYIIRYVHSGIDLNELNELDEYGFTPLIEAAIADNFEIAKVLIENGVNVNLQDMTGGTALHWAAENNNLNLAELLLKKGADPNAYTFAGQPILVIPILRQKNKLKNLLLKNGASLEFAQDFINTKLLGHIFELVGTANIIDPKNNFVELDFEGFYLEFSLAIIAESLAQFKNHFAARDLRRYNQQLQIIVDVIYRAASLIKYQQYRTDIKKFHNQIDQLITQEPLIIPVGYEGHAITFIKAGSIFIKCDRREESRLYDNVVFYHINQPQRMSIEFIKHLIYEKQSSHFINTELQNYLELQPLTEIKVAAQISGNCSWANVEATIPALFFLLFSGVQDFQQNMSRYKNMALTVFNRWREWNKTRTLSFCIQSFKTADSIRKVCKAEILGAILFQTCQLDNPLERTRVEEILEILTLPEYEYILKNYIQTYVYEDLGTEGKIFMQLLKSVGYIK